MLTIRFSRRLPTLATLVCCLAVPLVVRGQQPKDPPPATQRGQRSGDSREGGAIIERMRSVLAEIQLTDEQVNQLRSIMQQAREDIRALREELRQLEQQTRAQRLRQFMAELRQSIRGVLNDEQWQAFEQKIRQLRQEMRPGGGDGPATQPGARVAQSLRRLHDALSKLELTADQMTQIRQILQDARGQLKELSSQAQGAGQEIPEKFRAIMQETRQQIRSVLTPEQQQKLRELLAAPEGPQGAGQRGGRRQGGPGTRPAGGAP